VVTIGPKAPLVGRAAQMQTLREALGRARAGRPQLLVVVGEPGVGKSRLLSDLAEGVDEAVQVLVSHCLQLSGSVLPLAPIQGLVHRAYRRLGADMVRRAAGPYLPVLAVLEPALAAADAAGTTAGGVADQRQLFAAVRHLLEQLSEAGPLLVVVEDLHWADAATVDLLRYLTLSLENAPVLLTATVRAGPTAEQLLATVGRPASVTTVELGELSPEETARLAEELARHLPASGEEQRRLDVDRLVELSGGNPLYLEELVSARGSEGLPDSLRGLLLTRLESLPADARELVELVAIGDPPMRYEDLLSATGWPEDRLDSVLGQARANGVLTLTSTGRVAWRHPLLGDAARDALAPGKQRALHRSWATALSHDTLAGPQTALAIAHHWAQADEADQAIGAAWTGARAATALQDHATRAALLDRVIDFWSHADTSEIPADLVDVLSEAARSHELAGEYEPGLARLDQAAELLDPASDPGRAASMLVSRGRVEWSWHDTSPEPSLQRALDLLPDIGHDDVRARVLADWVDYRASVSQTAGIGEVAERAVRLSRAVGDAASEAKALRGLALARWLDVPAEAVALLRRAIALADQAGDYDVMLSAMGNLVFTRSEFVGQRERALDDAREFLATARQRGMDLHIGTGGLLIVAAQVQAVAGDLDAAQESARRAQTIVGEHGMANFCRSVCATIALIRGDVDTARAVLADVARSPHGHLDAGCADAASWLAWLDDGPDSAADVVLPYLQQALDAGDDLIVLVNSEQVLPLARYVRLSRPIPDPQAEGTRTLVALRDVYRRVVPHNAVVAVLDATLAPLDSADPAEHWRAAVSAYRQDPGLMTLYWHVDTLLRLAETTSDRAEALDALDSGERLARKLGSSAQLDEVTTLRQRLAGQPGPAGLTAREIEIVDLVAQGLTNSQIAATLFISRSTVGVHVSNILTKTGCADRHEAGGWAREHGLVRGSLAPRRE